MAVQLNKTSLKLYGKCNRCGGELYDILIETGEAACANCEQIERFDPQPFIEHVMKPSR